MKNEKLKYCLNRIRFIIILKYEKNVNQQIEIRCLQIR